MVALVRGISTFRTPFEFVETCREYLQHKVIADLHLSIEINRVINALFAGVVTVGYLTEEKATTAELLPDIIVHALTAYVSQDSNLVIKGVALFGNVFRIYEIFNFSMNGLSVIPELLSKFELLVHTGNVAAITTCALLPPEGNEKAKDG